MSEVATEKNMEEGECSSDDELTVYNPIDRPTDLNQARKAPGTLDPDTDSEDERPLGLPKPDSDSDSDEDKPRTKKRNVQGLWGRRDAIVPDSGNNETFKRMAAAFQQDRQKKKKNNVWGSILQEDSLNSELSGIGVKRSIRDLNSDRGAEAYDFNIACEIRRKERELKGEKDEMSAYWGTNRTSQDKTNKESEPNDEETMETKDGSDNVGPHKDSSERRGVKRNIRERIGSNRVAMDSYHGEQLAPPGESKHLIDINNEDLLEKSEQEFATLLAERLGEEKPALIEGFVAKFGKKSSHDVYKLTQKKEMEGGIETNNGARRRTSGGVFLYLIKFETIAGLDSQQVRKYLNQAKKMEERKILEAKSRRKKRDFDKEIEDFVTLKKEMKAAEKAATEMEEEESSEKVEKKTSDQPEANSVTSLPEEMGESRNLQQYDDDLFADTENIELL